MIREVTTEDATAINEIYNYYVGNSVITFETQQVSIKQMQERIEETASKFPYFVYQENNVVVGYCYAHLWKQRAAYAKTLETTVYVSHMHTGRGIGQMLMNRLIDECKSRGFHTLIACITDGNKASKTLHLSLGFKQVSHFKEVGYKFDRYLDVEDFELPLQ